VFHSRLPFPVFHLRVPPGKTGAASHSVPVKLELLAMPQTLVRAASILRAMSLRTRFLIGLWLLFLLLVGLGIHGSSLPLTAAMWSPEAPYRGYVSDILLSAIGRAPSEPSRLLMSYPRYVRSDEWAASTPLALAQIAHDPLFPVVNTNIGTGQNMLVWMWGNMPVKHWLAAARPSSWGYLLFDAQRGLAWAWWFQAFACFTVLTLLVEVILKGHWKLAAFGAFWFCGSAYVAAWSLWPSYVVLFPALACLCCYKILTSESVRVQLVCGIMLGLAIPGYLMIVYPPVQITNAYLFLLLFAGLFIRDKLYRELWPMRKGRAVALLVGLGVAGALSIEWVRICAPAMKIMSATLYPGQRSAFLGGNYPPWLFFKGLYSLPIINSITPNPPALANRTEASSFYLLFPAVFIAIALSGRLRRSLGATGFLLAGFLAAMAFFGMVGIPSAVAKLTLMGYVNPVRADTAVGLASILLCIFVHAKAKQASNDRWSMAPLIASAAVALLFGICGVGMIHRTGGFPGGATVALVSIAAGAVSYFMLAGHTRLFCGAMGAVVVATAGFFNPLSTNLDYIYKSELAREITRLNKESERPLWLCYGESDYPGTLVTLLGGRSLSGVQWPPQLDVWHALDPDRAGEAAYNRYAHVFLEYGGDAQKTTFVSPDDETLIVTISPDNSVMKSMGARYILAMREAQGLVDRSRFALVYQSPTGHFSIFDARPATR
jgi:hypothetical protein